VHIVDTFIAKRKCLMSVYGTLKQMYKKLLPKSVRQTLFLLTPRPLKKLRHNLIGVMERSALHDEIYDDEYYTELVDVHMAKSCDVITTSIKEMFSPKSAVDVGCGSGLLLAALNKRGVSCRGLEYSEAAIDICRQRGLDVTKFDLEHDDMPTGIKADVVISTEVAEHLPKACADRFVEILSKIADNIVLTAAEPSPNVFSTNHVNEQPNEYWIEKFQSRGFNYDQHLSLLWRKKWKESGVSPCHYKTVMVFRRKYQ